MNRLQDKVAVITGAGSGIARAAARLFAREGANVIVAELQPELGNATVAAIRDAGGEALFVHTDVTSEESVRQMASQAKERYGKIDVLYNCAGGSLPQDSSVTDVSMDVWSRTMSLDLLGPFLCCRHVVPELVARGGSIINMASVSALRGNYAIHVYVAAKGGVISLTRALAGHYGKHGVRANVICPGAVLTDRILERKRQMAAQAGSRNDQSSSGGGGSTNHPFSVGQPEDIANVALFLASDESRMITGAVIPADGGLSAY